LEQIPAVTLIGIDEQTGLINDGEGGMWTVRGAGEVTLYRAGSVETYRAGKTIPTVSF
jgi:cyanophycinase-like exopeptidase